MNIWSISSIFGGTKADSQSAVRRVAKPASPVCKPAAPKTRTLLHYEPIKQSGATSQLINEPLQPSPVGLNDLFDMSEEHIRKLSPTGNFSKLKNQQT